MLRISFSKCSKFTEIVIEIANVFHIFMSYHPARSSTIERIGRRDHLNSNQSLRNWNIHIFPWHGTVVVVFFEIYCENVWIWIKLIWLSCGKYNNSRMISSTLTQLLTKLFHTENNIKKQKDNIKYVTKTFLNVKNKLFIAFETLSWHLLLIPWIAAVIYIEGWAFQILFKTCKKTIWYLKC